MSTGLVVLVVAVLAATGFGLYRAGVDGRFRGTRRIRTEEAAREVAEHEGSVLAGTRWADQLGERATLLQFSSAFCAPCRAARHTLAAEAARTPGVVHLEVDAESHLDLVRQLGILRTPTTLVLDHAGQERLRASGAPRRDQITRALASLES